MTNGDRIRAMSDKELADFIAKLQRGAVESVFGDMASVFTGVFMKKFANDVFVWLRLPTEEET